MTVPFEGQDRSQSESRSLAGYRSQPFGASAEFFGIQTQVKVVLMSCNLVSLKSIGLNREYHSKLQHRPQNSNCLIDVIHEQSRQTKSLAGAAFQMDVFCVKKTACCSPRFESSMRNTNSTMREPGGSV
jgi:hypothetical protein